MSLLKVSRLLGLFSFVLIAAGCEPKATSIEPENTTTAAAMLSISHDAMLKIARKLESAKELGYLSPDDEDWVRTQMIFEGDTLFLNIRPIGDAVTGPVDSLLSFRVKVAKKGSFHGMRSFSIQPAANKGFGEEWMAHHLLQNEDVLTPRYGFFPLKVNGQFWGMYAWEEHFDKQLVESNKRREGPILRLDDNAVMELRATQKQKPSLVSKAEVLPFKSGRVAGSSVLKAQFLDAQRLLMQLRKNETPASDIYELNKLASVYAMADLMGSSDCLNWDNQRCYFNPVCARLEPVVYNCFNTTDPANGDLLGATFIAGNSISFEEIPFTDSLFVDAYIAALSRITQENYLEQVLNEATMPFAEGLKTHHGYELNTQKWIARRDEIKSQLAGLKDKFASTPDQTQLIGAEIQQPWQPVPSMSLRVYVQETDLQKVHTMLLINAFDRPIEVLGFGTKVSMCYGLDKPLLVEPSLDRTSGKLMSSRGKYCYFRVKGLGEVHRIPVMKWPYPEGKTARQIFAQDNKIPSEFVREGNRLTLPKGDHSFNESIYIPAGNEVYIEAGASITLNNCGWISMSPIFVKGTEADPVLFKGSNAQGFSIMNGHLRSSLSYCTFDGFGTQELPGWLLTGAVNFYESDVDMDHCHMLNNTCEDGLNIIHSDFKLVACEVAYTFSDGFDADYCTGEIIDSQVHHTANDCLDFSTSEISVVNCDVYDSGDKAVSAGENSTITVTDTQIARAHIGLASKDKSMLDVSNSSMDKCHFGYAIYQKKAEFGPASIHAVSVQIGVVDTLQLIESGSILKLDGVEIKGDQTIDLAKLYGL
ncbi:MAG: hypothetical protein ACI84C_000309 [Flavobacteriales bacterium]|jgi:hypothetical protein